MKSSKESQCKGIQTDESVEVVDHDKRAGMGVLIQVSWVEASGQLPGLG